MASHKNHQSKKYKHLREVCLWLHDYKCFITGDECANLEIHHLNKNSKTHELKNLVPVRPDIHVYLGRVAELEQLTDADIRRLLLRKLSYFPKE